MCHIFRAHCRSLWTIFLRPYSVRPIAAALSRWPSNTCLISWMSRRTRDRSLTRTYGTPGRATGEILRTSCVWPHFLQHLFWLFWVAGSICFMNAVSSRSNWKIMHFRVIQDRPQSLKSFLDVNRFYFISLSLCLSLFLSVAAFLCGFGSTW